MPDLERTIDQLSSVIEIQAREILYLRERLNTVLSEATGQPVDKIARDTDRDNFMSPDEAKAFGLVDEVVVSRKEVPGLPEKTSVTS